MKPVSFALAVMMGAGALSLSTDAQAETTNSFLTPFSGLTERLRQLDTRGGAKSEAPGYDAVRPGQTLPDLFGKKNVETRPVQMAQSAEAAFRVNQLEEQVRVLTGKVEEMTFQMLQLQEQIRRMQEDNEFRFQELEDQSSLKKRGNSTAGDDRLGKQQPSDDDGSNQAPSGGELIFPTDRKSIDDLLNGAEGGLGSPPSSLGTLTFDADGNLVDSNVGKPIDLTRQDGGTTVMPEDENELYNLGYSYVQAGDYGQAAETFREFVTRFPGSDRDQEARFWLGESLFAQGDYEASARIFLENHRANPSAPLAPQNLLKLGVSLAGMDQRELACATLAEVPKKYPSMSNAVRNRVAVEQAAAKCQNG